VPIKRFSGPAGRLVVLTHTSKVLAGNPLGDPVTRPLHVWLPPQYDDPKHPRRRFPVLFDLVGFFGSGREPHGLARLHRERARARGAADPAEEDGAGHLRLSRLLHRARRQPVHQLVGARQLRRLPDRGAHPLVDAEFRTLASREHRGCFGKSSGGYGAIVHGMKYAKHWGAIANHSGDSYFDFVYGADWPNTLDTLAKFARPKRKEGPIDVPALAAAEGLAEGLDDGRVARFLEDLHRKRKLGKDDGNAVMNLCMAASYDPDPKAPNGFRLPYHLETGERIEKRWRAWLAHDPIHLVKRHAKALKSLRGIYVDCGWADQFRIHYGTRILSQRLAEEGIAHTYEEFDDNHSDIDYRMDVSLPFLVKALS
jgi:hypothetical protein